MQNSYWWKKDKVPELKRDFVKTGLSAEGSPKNMRQFETDPKYLPDPSLKRNFLFQYRRQLVFSFLVTLSCGFMLYGFIKDGHISVMSIMYSGFLFLGFLMGIVLPFFWYSRFEKMNEIVNSNDENKNT